MNDCSYSISNTVLAWLAWGGGALLIGAGLITNMDAVGQAGLLTGAAGATLHVRGMIAAQAQREQSAFDLGRDSVRLLR